MVYESTSELNRNVTGRHRKKSSSLCIGPRVNTLFFFPEQVKAQNSYQRQIGEIFILRKEDIISLQENGGQPFILVS